MRKSGFAFILILAFGAAACSGDSTPISFSTSPKVEITDSLKFDPNGSKLHVGDQIVWTNVGSAPHTVTSDTAGGPMKSGVLNRNDSYSVTFNMPGTYPYHCTIHPAMRGEVVIQ